MKKQLAIALVAGFAAIAGSAGQASASLLVSDLGTSSLASPTALILTPSTIVGEANSGTVVHQQGNPFNDGQGWDPFGTNDITHYWFSIGGAGGAGTATFNLSGPMSTFSLLWGSPNDTNTVTLYSGLNGTGSVIGSVAYDTNSVVQGTANGNSQSPADYIQISSTVAFQSVVLSNSDGGFEVSNVSAVPLPGGLQLFGAALLGIGGIAWRKARRKA